MDDEFRDSTFCASPAMTDTAIDLLADARDTMRQILTMNPDLGLHGFRVRRAGSNDAEFATARDHMMGDAALVQFDKARYWWRRFEKTKRVNIHGTSRSLHSVAKRVIGEIAHGPFLAGAIAENFVLERNLGTPFAWFAISTSAWR
jgi:hypothetical protein